jgi:hypothetical protein
MYLKTGLSVSFRGSKNKLIFTRANLRGVVTPSSDWFRTVFMLQIYDVKFINCHNIVYIFKCCKDAYRHLTTDYKLL